MFQGSARLLCLYAAFAALAIPQERTTPAKPAESARSEALPIRRVVLYKNGVGYFEHLGKVTGKQDVSLTFTSGQLNDVLKSLTVLDMNGGAISGVDYNSSAPVDRELAGLRLPVGEKATLSEILAALRGARLEVRIGTAAITGRLLSVERKTRISGGTTLEVDYLSLLTDAGEVRTTEVSPQFSVKLLDRALAAKVEKYLDIAGSGRAADERTMVISSDGSGERSLFISYISEVPVWKTSYRVVIDAKSGRPPLLQGWAIVDNVVGQDWRNVQLSLVAGSPQSFIQNLSQPYYSRRVVVPLPDAAALAPQTYQATLVPGGGRIVGKVTDPAGGAIPNAMVKAYDANGAEAGEATTDSNGKYELTGLPDGQTRIVVYSPGFALFEMSGLQASAGRTVNQDAYLSIGSTAETVEVRATPTNMETSTATVAKRTSLGTGNNLGRALGSGGRGFGSGGGIGGGSFRIPGGLPAGAQAQQLGDLFEYKIKNPITVPKNRSAMVPIVNSSIGAEKVTVWNDTQGAPRRALWLTNSTGLTLDGGSFSLLDEDAFGGEGIFETIRPGEKRIVAYAADYGVVASTKQASEPQKISRVRIARGTLSIERLVKNTKTYIVRNADTTPRTVIVEHPVRPDYTLAGTIQPAETTAGWMRFRLPVPPEKTAELAVEEVKTLSVSYGVVNVGPDVIALLVKDGAYSPALEAQFRTLREKNEALSAIKTQAANVKEEIDSIYDDQQRLRENMKALSGSAEEKALLLRYTKQLNDQETRLEILKQQAQELDKKRDAAQADISQTVSNMTFDSKT